MRTTSRLLIGVFIGMLLGLLFGWVIRPVEYVDTAPEALREDFRSDYVLMVAEAYIVDRDLELARYKLASLGSHPPLNYVIDAIDFGVENGFLTNTRLTPRIRRRFILQLDYQPR